MIYIPAYKQLAGRSRNVRLVVMHATQSPERKGAARAVANWFANPDAGGSAHVTCDADEDVESVKPHNTAAGAPGANQDGYHIEQVGYSEQNAVQWDDDYSRRVIARSAARASWACEFFGLPKVWLSVTDIRAGKSGITDHVSCTLAFKKGSHWDPGPNWPRSKFMKLVNGATPQPEDDDVAKPPQIFTLTSGERADQYVVADGGVAAHHIDDDTKKLYVMWGAIDNSHVVIPADHFHCLDGPLRTP